MIVDSSGKATYQYPEKKFGEHAPLLDVLDQCNRFAQDKSLDLKQILDSASSKGLFRREHACSNSTVCSL